jgi:glycosyltransferase involved in cell wall biosynthesis
MWQQSERVQGSSTPRSQENTRNNILLLSFVVPFKNFKVLEDNLLKSFEEPHDCYEVIFVHDSTTKLEEKQTELLLRNKLRCKYIQGQFGSPGLARNRGVDEASGRWIVFWDSDDFGYPNKVCESVKDLGESFFIGNFSVFRDNRVQPSKMKLNSLESQVSINPGIWRFAFRSEIAKKCRFNDLKLGEDLIYLMDSGAFSSNWGISSEVIYEYRISATQSTKNMNIEVNLLNFFEKLVKKITMTKHKNGIVFKIFWRQLFSLVKISKGRKALFCFSIVVNVFLSLSPRDKIAFIQGIKIVLKRSII